MITCNTPYCSPYPLTAVNDFKKFDVDGDGRIERTEFCMKKLMLMGLVRAEDVMRIEEEFDIMDADASGEITFADLAAHIEKRESMRITSEELRVRNVGRG